MRYDIFIFFLCPKSKFFNDAHYFKIRGLKLNKIFMAYFSISPVFFFFSVK